MNAVRLVYYILDPYTGAREVVAAQVRDGARSRILRAPAPVVPLAARGAIERALADLEAEPTFDALPIGAGPQVIATEPRAIPEAVQDPAAWVRDVLLKPAA